MDCAAERLPPNPTAPTCQVKNVLGIPFGKATRAWKEMEELRQQESAAVRSAQSNSMQPELSQTSGAIPFLQRDTFGDLARTGVSRTGQRAPELADANGDIFMHTFAEDHPEYKSTERGKYFKNLRRNRQKNMKVICICVPCFNENQYGLNNTLNSLYALEVPPGFQIDVIILMDGALDAGDFGIKPHPLSLIRKITIRTGNDSAK
jgi:hypothetical protein